LKFGITSAELVGVPDAGHLAIVEPLTAAVAAIRRIG
jgi:hypothetical protein